MDNSIYEVEKEDYKTFIQQLNTEKTHKEESWLEQVHIVKIISNSTNTHLCSRISDSELEEEHYYIFNYPNDNERIAPKPVCTINLDTREEVQTFFNALSKLQRGEEP
jgi:hypothetical protein